MKRTTPGGCVKTVFSRHPFEKYERVARTMETKLKEVLTAGRSEPADFPPGTLYRARNFFQPGSEEYNCVHKHRGALSFSERSDQLWKLGQDFELLTKKLPQLRESQRGRLGSLQMFFEYMVRRIDQARFLRRQSGHVPAVILLPNRQGNE